MNAQRLPLPEHTVRISNSGREFSVAPGETILEAALRQGVGLPYSCRNGTCGSCKGRLESGRITYEVQPGALTEQERAEAYVLPCQALPLTDIRLQVREVAGVADIPVRTLPCRVARMQRASHDVMVLHLKLPESERLQFLAGQYVDILLRDGRQRSFSLANAPYEDGLLELHVRHVAGGSFTAYVFNELKEKALLRLQGPLGSFFLREDSDRPVVMLAGGTGIAPVKGMLAQLLRKGMTRPVQVYWGVRARRDLYLDELLRTWADGEPRIHYIPVLSDPLAEDGWTGRRGLVHRAVLEDFPDLAGYEVYASGPPAMVHGARDAFLRQGLDRDHMYSDAFEFAHDRGQQ